MQPFPIQNYDSRGNSRPLDISIDKHLKEVAENESGKIRIVIEGRDE
jgi:hypothetical protein